MSEHAHVDGVYPSRCDADAGTIETNGTSIQGAGRRAWSGGVMLHGFGTTGDMWVILGERIIEDHWVCRAHLLGLGSRQKPCWLHKRIRRGHGGVLDALVCLLPNW